MELNEKVRSVKNREHLMLDGVVSISEEDIEIEVMIKANNEKNNGELQDLFLEYDEENR
ncbi:hypothetical protein [Neobacillus drentensis]|uniref:hypothetical protein n=1 Tax=Neobacillus drentensis TaxID=220684 RepID=UPI0030031FC0